MARTKQIVIPHLDEEQFLGFLLSGEAEPRQAFLRSFRRRLPPIARQLAIVYRELTRLDLISRSDERLAHVHMFLHDALNSAFTSTMLLIEGYPLASGNLMRHYAEATAMALLIMDDNPEVWQRYEAAPTQYPVQKAIDRLLQGATSRRLRKLFGFDPVAWHKFLQLTRFYDQFSHASAFSLGFHMMIDQPGIIILGPQFDPGKRKQVGIELKRRRSCLRPLAFLVRSVRRVAKHRVTNQAA
jgi:hypothetical protein